MASALLDVLVTVLAAGIISGFAMILQHKQYGYRIDQLEKEVAEVKSEHTQLAQSVTAMDKKLERVLVMLEMIVGERGLGERRHRQDE